MFKKINCDSYLFEKIVMIRKNIFYLKKTLL